MDEGDSKIIRENKLDFYLSLYHKGVDIGEENISLLHKHKLLGGISNEPIRDKIIQEALIKRAQSTVGKKAQQADKLMDIIELTNAGLDIPQIDIVTDIELEQRRKEYGHIFMAREKPILSHEWKPKSIAEHTPEFVEWIDSINKRRFSNKTYYREFTLYCQQAYQWLSEQGSYTDYEDEHERMEFMLEELRRCDENTLYWLNKYVWYKEGSSDEDGGQAKYIATPVHEFLAYMHDCNYSLIFAKGRQQAATTTIMALKVHDLVFKTNHFIKFITEDKDKAEEIIDDKLKFCFSSLPWWMTPDVMNERDDMFRMGYKPEKGRREGVGSKILVSPPKRTAIAGGAPQQTDIDEAGNIGNLGQIISNVRPTMLYFNPRTRKLEIKRKMWIWGCVCAGTKVWTNDGSLVNIENLKKEDGIIGYNGKTISKEPITWMKPPAEKPCYRITTTGGNFIECSNDHPLLYGSKDSKKSYNKKILKFKKAEEIIVGDQLMMIDEVPLFGEKRVEYARLLGLMIGDGCYSANSTPQLSVAENEIGEYLKDNFNFDEFSTKIYKTKTLKNGKDFTSVGIKGLHKILKNHKIYGQSKDNKRLPFDINTFDKKSLSELIAGYFDADGNIKSKGQYTSVVLTSSVLELLTEVKFQLHKFGISSSITTEKRNGGVKISEGQKDHIHRLYINNQYDVIKFKEEIPIICKHKQEALQKATSRGVKKFGILRDGIFEMSENGKGKHFLGNKEMNGLRFKRVEKVEFIGNKPIYNLTAGATHTYIANGFVTANTGGEMDKGGKAFETETVAMFSLWDKRDFSSGIIPIFFDWTCRVGATQERYDSEKRVAYEKGAGTDPDAKKHITEFHQSWPSTLSDVFRTSAKTLVDDTYIEAALERIRATKQKFGHGYHKSGYFDPVFDYNEKMPEGSDVDYKIIGATFIPTKDTDARATVTIFMDPEKSWENRYWQGTDPIDTDTGLSNMASAVFDKHFKTISAILNWRTRDYRQVFMQTLLMGLYFDSSDEQKGIPELLEANRGTSYSEYKKNKGFGDSLVLNYQLPYRYQNKSSINEGVGIDNKQIRNTMIINDLHDFIELYGDRMNIEVFFEQLKTFTCKISDTGKEMWGVVNKKYFKDDVLFAVVFSYICSELCFPEKKVKDIGHSGSKGYKIIYKLVRGKDLKLSRVPVKVAA